MKHMNPKGEDLTMQKRAFGVAVRFLLFLLLFAVIAGLFSVWAMHTDRHVSTLPDDPPTPADFTVVIDAGHGGEDGGCEGNGLVEKDLNLDISLRIATLLREAGVRVVMTREEDVLLYDKSSDFVGKKKAQDVRRRLEIAKECENPVLVSIHMNYFAQTQYSGLQVWYSKNDPSSKSLANLIQSKVKATLQQSNKRTIKEATSSIFLLHNATFPAVLIECGFLSNKDDARALSNADYRHQLTKTIFSAIMDYISQNNT
jgi:N-acetylmuramoyl-L-alanine amidase